MADAINGCVTWALDLDFGHTQGLAIVAPPTTSSNPAKARVSA
jgi:hypothetical protein